MKTPPIQPDVTPTAAGKLLASRNSFTIIELVVVLTIIALLMTVVLPGISDMWEQRKIASAHNTLIGAINLAKMTALEKRTESGLFFALDEDVQRIYPIESAQDPDNRAETQYTFKAVDGKVITMPKPMRAAPLNVFERGTGLFGMALDVATWSPNEIANDDYRDRDTTLSYLKGPQRHRNFFTLIFSSEGELIVNRDVIVQDTWEATFTSQTFPTGGAPGPKTGLIVHDTLKMPLYNTTDDDVPVDTEYAIVDSQSNPDAVNFKSVNGVVLYNEDVLKMQGDMTLQLKYMHERTRPLFVHPITGTITRVDPEQP